MWLQCRIIWSDSHHIHTGLMQDAARESAKITWWDCSFGWVGCLSVQVAPRHPSIRFASQDQGQHIRTTSTLWHITLLKQDSIRRPQGHIHIVPTRTLTRRRRAHTPTQLARIRELLLQDTVQHGLIPIAITSPNLPVRCQSLLLPNQPSLRELRLCPPAHSGPLSQLITPHTPVTAPELAPQQARLPAHTKNSPTSKDCLPKSVRPFPSCRIQP